MRILVLGARGQLGTDLCEEARRAGHDVIGADLPELDITDAAAVADAVGRARPQVVMNPAAYTAVDTCETDEARAYAVNCTGAHNAAAAAQQLGALMVHFSTDYVFAGDSPAPYTESDLPAPATAYGRTKHAGELAVAAACERHQILRIAWLYGAHGANFVKAILGAAQRSSIEGTPLRVVNDQRGTPTWTVDVSRQALALACQQQVGVFHCTAEGACTWFDFAARIVRSARLGVEVLPCSTRESPRPAPRPANSVLENARLKALGLNLMPAWEHSWDRFFALCRTTLLDRKLQ